MQGKFRFFVSTILTSILLVTLFLPAFSPLKKKAGQLVFSKSYQSADGQSSQSQNQNASVNFMEEEEEEEYMPESADAVDLHLPLLTVISFFTSEPFFKDHFMEVSSLPPWL